MPAPILQIGVAGVQITEQKPLTVQTPTVLLIVLTREVAVSQPIASLRQGVQGLGGVYSAFSF